MCHKKPGNKHATNQVPGTPSTTRFGAQFDALRSTLQSGRTGANPRAGTSHQLYELPGAWNNRSLSSLSLGHQTSEIKVSQCSALSRSSSGESFLPLPASGVSRHPWACGPLPPIFAFTWCLLCVSVLGREGALLSWSCLSGLGDGGAGWGAAAPGSVLTDALFLWTSLPSLLYPP